MIEDLRSKHQPMSRALVPIMVLTLLHQVHAQAPAIAWEKALGGTAKDEPTAISPTTDGGSVVAGVSYSDDGDAEDNNGSGDVWVLKLDALGNVQWEKNYGGSGLDAARDVIQTSDGGYLITAFSESSNGDVPMNLGFQDVWVLKLNSAGNLEWQTVRGGSVQEQPWSCSETVDGYLIGGSTGSNDNDVSGNHGSFDIWVFKLDLNGAFQWQRCYGGSASDVLTDAQALGDGGFILAGFSHSTDGDVSHYSAYADYWVVRIDAVGDIVWENCYGGNSGDGAWSVDPTLDGGFLVCGETQSADGMVTNMHGNIDIWVIKLDASGALEWERALGGTAIEIGGRAEQLPDGRCVVVGEAWSTNGDLTGNMGLADLWVVMLDATGDLIWQKNMGGSMWERGRDLAISTDGAILAAGVTSSNDGDVTGYHLPYQFDNSDFWVVKLFPDAVGMSEQASSSIQLMPNPAQDQLQVMLDPALAGSRYAILDVAGRVQHEALVQATPMDLDITTLPAGMYTLWILTPDGLLAQRWVKR